MPAPRPRRRPPPPRRLVRIEFSSFFRLHGRAGGAALPLALHRDAWWPADAFFLQIDEMFGGLDLTGGFAYVDRMSMQWDCS